jgi:AP-1 complex subunit sigma 1/2
MIELILLVSRQGKVRLTKFYDQTLSKKDRLRIVREVTGLVLQRGPKMCNFVEYKGRKIVYKRYASLFFVCLVSQDDNELIVLESIHHYVEILDQLFNNVCELDIIFNFTNAFFALDEVILGGEIQETSKREVLRVCAAQDDFMEEDDITSGRGTR